MSHAQSGAQSRLMGSELIPSQRMVLTQWWDTGAMCLGIKPHCNHQGAEAQRGGTSTS